MSYEALVVGSGPNGLAAGITLARAGKHVLVLEAAPHPGGAVASEELTLPGFIHDPFSSVYPAGAASPVFAAMPLHEHGLRWIHPRACLAHPLPDGTAAVLYRNLEQTQASLDATHPGDGASWRAFAAPFVEHFEALRRTMLGGFPPVRGPLGLASGLGGRGILDFTRLLFMPAQRLGEQLFAGEGARAWLYGSAMHSDVPPARRGSAIAAAYLNLLGHGAGWPSPEGGAARLADALLSYLRSLGGDVRTGAQVRSVAVERGRVVGVELADGERLSAPLVIADVMPAALVELAGEALPARYARAMGRFRLGPATLKVDWALEGQIPWSASLRASASGSSRAMSLAPPICSGATPTSWEGMWGAGAMPSGRSSSAPYPRRRPTGRRCAVSTSAAPPPSPVVLCMVSRGMLRRVWRSPRSASGAR